MEKVGRFGLGKRRCVVNSLFLHPSKTQFPITTDLIFRLLAVNVLGNSYLYADDYKLPFFDVFQNIIALPHLSIVLSVIVLMGVFLMLLTKFPRVGTLLIITSMSIIIFGCRACYADSRLFIFSLMILLTLYQKVTGLLFIRLQVVVLYFGSGMNKLFDADWHSGQYIDNWLGHQLEFGGYLKLSSILPSLVFAKIVSWSVILFELFMAFCFTRKRLYMIGIWLGVILHSGSMIAANSVFGSFVAGSFIAYLAFLEWPNNITITLTSIKGYKALHKMIRIIDPYRVIKVELGDAKLVAINNRTYVGFRAFQLVLLYCPACYLLVIGMIVAPGFGFDWIKGVAIMIIACLMLPIWSNNRNRQPQN